jgi:hypothetical protein
LNRILRRAAVGSAGFIHRKQEDYVRQVNARSRLLCALIATGSVLLAAGCTKGSSDPKSAAAVSGIASASASSAGVDSADPSPTTPASSSAPAYGLAPLTGALAASAAAATRPALGVKIDNVDGAWPQAGLNQADIVFDLPVEGGLTRLLAVFHSQDVALFGPIRSARPVDADLLHLLGHPYFAFSGGTKTDLGPIADHSNATPMWWDVTPGLFIIRRDHAVPHQVFGSTAQLYAGGQQRAASTTPPPPIFSYSATAPTGAPAAKTIAAAYDAATATWTWNGSQYLRDQSGHPDILLDGGQVSATNIVVMSVGLQSTGARDSHGTVVPLPVVLGSGTAWVFRNGVQVKGIWSRPSENSPMKLQTSSGQIITLAPGRAWVEVLPNSRQPQIS